MRKEEILIVEDDFVSATIIKKMLTSKGFTSCAMVPRSKDALDYVGEIETGFNTYGYISER